MAERNLKPQGEPTPFNKVPLTWHKALASMQAEYERLVSQSRWLGGPIDLLSIIGASRKETFHSSLVAWLCDPGARHGLGPSFLSKILQKCFPGEPVGSLSSARPECEVSRFDTRTDIVIWGDGFTLVIENKVNAGEQYQQCDRIFKQFRNEPGACFVFLTPTGYTPATATGEALEAFRLLSYQHLRELLLQALNEAQPATTHIRARESAWNYLETLEKEFP